MYKIQLFYCKIKKRLASYLYCMNKVIISKKDNIIETDGTIFNISMVLRIFKRKTLCELFVSSYKLFISQHLSTMTLSPERADRTWMLLVRSLHAVIPFPSPKVFVIVLIVWKLPECFEVYLQNFKRWNVNRPSSQMLWFNKSFCQISSNRLAVRLSILLNRPGLVGIGVRVCIFFRR